MRIEVKMPNLGYDMETGVIAGWKKAPGDSVERGEALAEIETDKSTVEMESTATGILVEIIHDAGAEVAIGQTIAFLEVDP